MREEEAEDDEAEAGIGAEKEGIEGSMIGMTIVTASTDRERGQEILCPESVQEAMREDVMMSAGMSADENAVLLQYIDDGEVTHEIETTTVGGSTYLG